MHVEEDSIVCHDNDDLVIVELIYSSPLPET